MFKYLLIAIFLFSLAPVMNSQPKLNIEGGDTVNWGRVKANDPLLKRKVIFRNTGTDTLKISKVKPSCGCTTAPISKENIAPGDTALLDVALTMPGHPGEIHKLIFINSNDPTNKDKMLHLMAEIYSPLKFFPDKFVMLNNMPINRESVGKIIITNISAQPIKFMDAKSEPSDIKFNLENGESLQPGQEKVLSITAKATAVGTYMGWVKVKTDNEDLPKFELSIRGVVLEPDQEKK